jgi:hypothetical protein
MATHIKSVAGSELPKVSKADLYSTLLVGDLVFCSGQADISKGIEGVTSSPFSHVLKVWLPWPTCPEWLTLESTDDKGVHVGRFGDYVDTYDGNLVLARRPALTQAQILQELNTGFALLDDKYDFIEEGSMAVRKLKLFSKLPDIKPAKELFCSGLQQAIAENTIPYKTYDADWNTPEQIYIDPSVAALAALIGGAS